eukprot:gene5609-7164_t
MDLQGLTSKLKSGARIHACGCIVPGGAEGGRQAKAGLDKEDSTSARTALAGDTHSAQDSRFLVDCDNVAKYLKRSLHDRAVMKIGIERRPLAAWESGVAETAARPLGREVEVKFRADDGALAAVAASALLKGASVGKAQELVSTYFESPAFDLQRAGLSLRVRRKGRAIPLMGVKWESGVADEVFARGEAEVRCPGGIPDPALLEGAIRERVVKLLETRPLTPIFETRIKRRALLVTHGHSTIELSLDEGSIIAGGASLPVAE